MSAAGRHPVIKAGSRPFSSRTRDRRCLIAPMRQAHLTVPRDMELQGYSTWPPPYSVSVVPVSSRTVEPRHVLGISVLNRSAARGASRYSPGTRYHAPTASVGRFSRHGLLSTTTGIWRPAAARLCLLLIFLLYRCSEEEDRRRRQKTLWLCLCMQMHDVFLAGTAGAHCRG